MSILRGVPWLVVALVASVLAMSLAVAGRRAELAGAAAGLFVLVLILAGLVGNRRLWRLPPERIGPAAAPVAGVRNAVLLAVAYGWGASALAAIYLATGITWQHGLQYAAAMALVAAAILAFARQLGRPDSWLRQPGWQRATLHLTVLQAAGAAAGLGFLFLSGKLASPRGDWPANIVFLMGGTAVLALSVIAALTQWRLSRR